MMDMEHQEEINSYFQLVLRKYCGFFVFFNFLKILDLINLTILNLPIVATIIIVLNF